MMTKITICMLALLTSLSSGMAQEDLPREARKLINELELAEFKDSIALEKKFISKKEDMIQTIQRVASKLKGKDSAKIKGIAWAQVAAYKREIKEAKKVAVLEKALSIVQFNAPYVYVHPISKYKHQRCSITFLYDGTAYLIHEDDDSGDFEKEWRWSVTEDGKIYIKGDNFHGPMYITKHGLRDISIQWKGKINKTNRARLKNN